MAIGKKKIGLTLAGGGAKGAYQVGVCRALQESKIKIDAITGTSIGSFNGAMVAADELDRLEFFWLNEDIGKLMGLFENDKMSNSEYKAHIKDIAEPVKLIIKNKGISIEKLRKRISILINEEGVRNSKVDFGLVTYKMKDKKPLYLFKDDIPNGKLADYIVSSCYLPVFQYEKLDDDSFYLDGAFFDNVPYNMLGEKGYDKIYVVELGSIGRVLKNKTNAEIIKIKPSKNLGGMLNTNKYKIQENIKLGYYDGIKIFKNLDGNKFIFKKNSEWFYNFITRKISLRTLNRAEVFFITSNRKEIVLKSLEYILKREKKTYFNIYNPYKEIKRIKNDYKNDKYTIAYQFIKEINIL